MPSEYKIFRASLLRRFSSTEDTLTERQKRNLEKSFSVGYLQSFKSDSHDELFDVALTKVALRVARHSGKEVAAKVVERFSEGNLSPASLILEANEALLPNPRHYCDRFLAASPRAPEELRTQTRRCYDAVLCEKNILTPLDKHGMLKLLRLVDKSFSSDGINTFAQLRQFTWEFATRTWPLFDASILHIPMRYFRFDHEISMADMTEHLAMMSSYGLERLLARLIVLRAVCNVRFARDLVREVKILEYCQFQEREADLIERFLAGRKIKLEKDDLQTLGIGNPIERAVFACIYIFSFTSEFDFMEKFIEVHRIDESVLSLIDWGQFSAVVRDCSGIPSPQLVALAAILSQGTVLERSQRFKALYVPTSANTQLLKYALYFRSQSDRTAFKFFRSFAVLPKSAQRAVFLYLLQPGVLDGLSNVFPSGERLLTQIERDDAINALSLKLDCISYLKLRKVLPSQLLNDAEESARHRLRQVKYEDDVSGGRIHFSAQRLRSEIERFFEEEFVTIAQLPKSNDEREVELRTFLMEEACAHFADKLANHICFGSKVAIDYLLSNLRHNFLRFKLETAIDNAFEKYPDPDVVQFKTAIKSPLDEYCKVWLTISKTRSFYNGLRSMILSHLQRESADGPFRFAGLSDKITSETVDSFERLLSACKQVWGSQIKSAVQNVVQETLQASIYRSDSALVDALASNFDYIFSDTEGWLAINRNPIRPEFALRELFLFEATNFSSARTRRKAVSVICYDRVGESQPVFRKSDIYLPGELFGGVVQLVQNLLQNAFRYCSLPISMTSIDVSIFDLRNDRIEIEFRNSFASDKKREMQQRVVEFNERVAQAKAAAANSTQGAPLQVGGSGLRRIFFDLYDNLRDEFWIAASADEISKEIFLVKCRLSKGVAR